MNRRTPRPWERRGWGTERGKFHFREIDERAGARELPLLSVSVYRGVIPRSEADTGARAGDLSIYKVVQPGDLVINRMSAYQGALGRAPIEGLVSPEYMVLRPERALDANFLGHLAKSSWFVSEMTARLRGIGTPEAGNVRTPRVNVEAVGDIAIPLPALSGQRAIADFLDRESARIDALIAKKEQASKKVEERFSASTELAFEEWERVPLKRLIEFTEGPGILSPHFRDEGIPLLKLASLAGPEVSIGNCPFLDPKDVAQRWQHFAVREGDYLISGSATMGIVSVVTSVAAGSIPYTGIIRCRPRSADVDMRFIRFFLTSQSFTRQIEVMRTGTAIQHFGPSHLAAMWVPNPSLAKQWEIANHLDREFDLMTRLKNGLARQIVLLRERRQALITAAVTGQLEIPEAA